MNYADRVNSFASKLSEAGEHIRNIQSAVRDAPDQFDKISSGINATAGALGNIAEIKTGADHFRVIRALANRGIKKPLFGRSAEGDGATPPSLGTSTAPAPTGTAGRSSMARSNGVDPAPNDPDRLADGQDFDADFRTFNDQRASGDQSNLGQHPTDADADHGNIRTDRPNQGTDGSSNDAGAGSGEADSGDAGGSSLDRPPMSAEEQNLFPAGSAPEEGGGQALSGAVESLAPEEIAGGLEAAAPETGPLAPFVAAVGGLVQLGTSIADAFHHTDMPKPVAPKVNVGENLSQIRSGDSGMSAIF